MLEDEVDHQVTSFDRERILIRVSRRARIEPKKGVLQSIGHILAREYLPDLFAHFSASVRAAVIANRANLQYWTFASGFMSGHNGKTSSTLIPDVPV